MGKTATPDFQSTMRIFDVSFTNSAPSELKERDWGVSKAPVAKVPSDAPFTPDPNVLTRAPSRGLSTRISLI